MVQLEPINNGTAIDLNSLNPMAFTLIVVTNPTQVSSVDFYVNGNFFHNSNTLPYTINQKMNNLPAPLNPMAGTITITAVPFTNNNNVMGTPSTIVITFVQLVANANAVIGPAVLQTTNMGTSIIQMQSTPATANFLISQLDFLFSPNAQPVGNQYQILIYAPTATQNTFSLVSVNTFTINPILTIPTQVLINPPVAVLQGQFIAIANPAGTPLPVPDGITNNNFNLLLSPTAPSTAIGSTITLTLTANVAPSWRVTNLAGFVPTSLPTTLPQTSAIAAPAPIKAAAAAPNTPVMLTTGGIVGIVIGVLIFVAIIIGIAIFAIGRYIRNNSEEERRIKSMNISSRPAPLVTERSTSPIVRDPNSSHVTTPAIWPPHESGIFVDSSAFPSKVDMKEMRKTTAGGEIPVCTRCDEREATVECKDCKTFFCHQCMLELHYSADSRWSGHVIQPFRLYN